MMGREPGVVSCGVLTGILLLLVMRLSEPGLLQANGGGDAFHGKCTCGTVVSWKSACMNCGGEQLEVTHAALEQGRLHACESRRNRTACWL